MSGKYIRMAIAILLATVLAFSLAYAQGPAADLFQAKCKMCHGPDGAGKTPMGKTFNVPDLRSVQKKPATELGQSITKGKNKMPAFDGKLTKDQIGQLVSYVQQLK